MYRVLLENMWKIHFYCINKDALRNSLLERSLLKKTGIAYDETIVLKIIYLILNIIIFKFH